MAVARKPRGKNQIPRSCGDPQAGGPQCLDEVVGRGPQEERTARDGSEGAWSDGVVQLMAMVGFSQPRQGR